MTRTFYPAALAAALAFAGAAQAEVTLYKQANFAGDKLTLRSDNTNLEGTKLYDAASSIIVHSGEWEFCSSPQYRGDCVKLKEGKYATLDKRLNHRVESVRQVAWNDDRRRGDRDGRWNDRDRDGRPDRGDRRGGASVELYGQPEFGGRSVEISRDATNLEGSGLNDRASSLVVNEGVWQLCSESNYNGTCRVYTPGRYPELDRRLDDRVSSVRQLEGRR